MPSPTPRRAIVATVSQSITHTHTHNTRDRWGNEKEKASYVGTKKEETEQDLGDIDAQKLSRSVLVLDTGVVDGMDTTATIFFPLSFLSNNDHGRRGRDDRANFLHPVV